MATEEQWGIISRHFSPSEFDDGVGLSTAMGMSWPLLDRLFCLRCHLGQPIRILSGYAKTGHKRGSEHYDGEAVDIHVKGCDLPQELFEMWTEVERWDFRNIGVYPYWNSPGFHLGIRVSVQPQAHPAGARWGRGPEPNDYVPLTWDFWKKAIENHQPIPVGGIP